MTGKFILLGVLSLAALPSCMHPVDQVIQARAEAKQSNLEATGKVSQGACDDIGQYIAQNSAGDRLTVQNQETASALLMVR